MNVLDMYGGSLPIGKALRLANDFLFVLPFITIEKPLAMAALEIQARKIEKDPCSSKTVLGSVQGGNSFLLKYA